MAIKKGGLGKGLDAIFNENATDRDKLITVNINDIEPNREQPRKSFSENSLNELAESIREHGLLQPIIVKPMTNGAYQIVAGERRWRAGRKAGLSSVPVIVKELSEQEVMEVALIENLQRQDLNPVEEAIGYQTLMRTYGMTQEEVSKRVGKSRAAVANALRLLNLPEKVLDFLRDNKITASHARTILGAGDDVVLVEKLIEMSVNGDSVRELEKAIKAAKTRRKPDSRGNVFGGFPAEVELALTEALHRKVKVQMTGEDHGVISIEFYGNEELQEIAAKLGGRKW